MPHQNTVFRQVSKRLPWAVIEQSVAKHRADKGIRRLSTRDLLLTLLFAQLSSARGLRDIEAILQSQDARRYHSGLPTVCRSTLADAAARRPVAVFTDILTALIPQIISKATSNVTRGVRKCVRLIDSTTMPLNRLSANWAKFSATLCGVKAHVVFDPDANCPLYLSITPARVNDITAAHDMPIDAGATYVFDLGYYDYGWWAKLDAAGCRIVTRLRSCTPLAVTETRPVPAEAENIISDRIGLLPQRMKRSRRNPMSKAVREIEVKIDSGKVLRVVTNDLTAAATEIADLYKRRWAIELFFRWIKQALKLRHFFGTTDNAVRIQIIVALIAFVLIKLAHDAQNCIQSLTTFGRLIHATVLHRKPLDRLGKPKPLAIPSQNQPQSWLFAQ